MLPPAEITGLILAGGGSRRFGSDKALADRGGVSFVERVAWAIRPYVRETLIATGREPRLYPVDARVVLDPIPRGGPLAGLEAGLSAASTPWVLAVAVDMPDVTSEALAPILAPARRASSVDVIVSEDADRRAQPLCALWRVETVLPEVRRRLEGRELKVYALLEALESLPVRLTPAALANVNERRVV